MTTVTRMPLTNPVSNSVSAEVHRRLAETGTSVNALAKTSGIPQSRLCRKLRPGGSALTVDEIDVIAAALGVEMADLLVKDAA